jgi:hypothetical protein
MTDAKPSYADTIEGQCVLDFVSNGMTLIDACRSLGISYFGIYRTMNKDRQFMEAMEEARTCGYEIIANKLLGVVSGDAGQGSTLDVKRDKLIADTMLKLLAKWHPKRYGEKLEIEQKTATIAIPSSDDPILAQRAYEQLMKGS